MLTSALPNREAIAGNAAMVPARVGPSRYLLFGLGLATWIEFYTYGVNLVLPDMAGTLGIPQTRRAGS